MKVESRKLTEIKPYPNNPRINDNSVELVANSIKEFGFKNPIIVDKDGVIIAGHTRYKAAKQLRLKEVPVIVADDLTEEQVQAYRLADNKVGEGSMWDYDLLDLELGDIGIDMEQFGFLGESPVFDDPDPIIGNGEEYAEGSVLDSFAVTILFKKEYETLVHTWIKDHGKDELAAVIVQALEDYNAS